MRKILLWFNVLLFTCLLSGMESFAQGYVGSIAQPVNYSGSRTGDILYDQMDQLGTNYIVGAEYTNSANKTETSFAADDFVVPEGESWNIGSVKIVGIYPDFQSETSDTVHVYFYNDNAGMPGDEIYSFSDITNFNEILIDSEYNIYELEVSLPEIVSLNEGNYWMSVQVKSDQGVNGTWGWIDYPGETLESPYHWKNPLDGFGTGFTNWTNSEMLLWFPPYNLAFALYSEGLTKDMAVKNVTAPETMSGLTGSEAITVSIKNEGTEPQSNFDVSYSINGGALVTENIGTNLVGPNQFYDFTFTTTADLSIAGEYEIVVSVYLDGDEDASNNIFNKSIYNLGDIYQITDTTTVTTCSGTFTDPGGLSGDIISGMASLTTFYPESEGDRVRLSFLTFNTGWSEKFAIYDGENTDAPLIGEWEGTDTPGVITALNPTGALTIDFVASGWDTAPGWSAYISCLTPADDDFAVTALNSNIVALFTGTEATLTAGILNSGTLTQAKDVTFTVNGTVIGTVNTGDLGSGLATEVTMLWTPTVADDYVIEASVEADAGTEDNNSASIELTVLPFDTFYEPFESGLFPPEEWSTSLGMWFETDMSYAGQYAANIFVPYEMPDGDTLISPRLNIEDGAILKFAALSAPWFPGNLEILWMDASTGDWHHIQHIEFPMNMFGEYEIDLSAAAGEGNYIGFHGWFNDPMSWAGQVVIDEITGTGITRKFDNNDIKSSGLEGNQFINAFEETIFNFTVKNNGLNEQSAGSYTVKLMQMDEAGDIELTSIEGLHLNSMQKIDYQIPYTFTEIGAKQLYATIDFPTDDNPENNASNIVEAVILPGGSEIITVDDESDYTSQSPVNVNVENSLSETIYTSAEIGQDGLITGISYDYTFIENVEDAAVRIWIGQTDSTDLSGPEYSVEWIPATEMTLVYDGSLNYYEGEHSVFVQLETPYQHENNNNLVIMTEKIMDTYYDYMNQFEAHPTGDFNATAQWTSTDEIPNPEDPYSMGGWASTTSISPNIHFIFNNDITTFNGTVTDEEGNSMADATVIIEGLLLETNTNAEGFYEFDQVSPATYNVTASMFGYYDNTQEVNVYLGSTSNLDFTMEAIPTYAINGIVVGSNDESIGLQGATVTLDGYDVFETFTVPGGAFAIDGIYNFGIYILEIRIPGYEVYHAEIEITEDTDLGTIILNELFITAFNAVGIDEDDQVSVVWNAPNQLAEELMIDDDGSSENGYAADINEEVSLGNLFENDGIITITSVDIYWEAYTNGTSVPVRLDIYNAETDILIASSQAFNTGLDEWITVDVPNLTLESDFYVMVYWNGSVGEISSYLGTDLTESNANNAYYYYPNDNFYKFETLIEYPSNFMIRPNIMTEATKGGDREVLSYNVYKGMADDVAGVTGWDKINNFPVTETTFVDTDWPPVYSDDYMYAVEAIYTEGTSEVVFSTPVHYQEPILPVENLVATDSLGYTIGWALLEWNAPQGANPIAYNIYLNNNSTPEATVTGTSYTFHNLPAETYAAGVTAVYASGESEAEVVSFTITIDVEDMDAANLSVYPNPATDYVVLDLDGSANVEIFNTIGDIVQSIESYNGGTEINIENLEAGAYFFRITNNNETSLQKVIVK